MLPNSAQGTQEPSWYHLAWSETEELRTSRTTPEGFRKYWCRYPSEDTWCWRSIWSGMCNVIFDSCITSPVSAVPVDQAGGCWLDSESEYDYLRCPSGVVDQQGTEDT